MQTKVSTVTWNWKACGRKHKKKICKKVIDVKSVTPYSLQESKRHRKCIKKRMHKALLAECKQN